MGRHAQRQVREGGKRSEVHGFEVVESGLDRREVEVTVDRRAAVTGHMLHYRKHTALQKPLREGATKSCNALRIGAISAAADGPMGVRCADIEDRCTIDRDPDVAQVGGDQLSPKVRRLGAFVGAAVDGSRRVGSPVWRTAPLDTAPFLVNEHRCVVAADARHARDPAVHVVQGDVVPGHEAAPAAPRRPCAAAPRPAAPLRRVLVPRSRR